MIQPPTIPYAPPVEALEGLRSGALKVVGAVVSDARSGKIVAHMQRVGEIGRATAGGAGLGPVGAIVGLGSSLTANGQLVHLQHTVNSIKLISSVGAVASVAGIGISVAGFAMVMAKLDRIDGKLDALVGQFEAVRSAVSGLGQKLDLMSLARLRHAAQLLDNGDAGGDRDLARRDLLAAAHEFGELRAYFGLLLRGSPLAQPDLPVEAALEAYGRFTAAAVGELKARLLLDDLESYRVTALRVAEDVEAVLTLDPVALFNARMAAATGRNFAAMYADPVTPSRLKETVSDLAEARDRLNGAVEVAHYLEAHGISPRAYVAALREAREPGLVFLPNGDWKGTTETA